MLTERLRSQVTSLPPLVRRTLPTLIGSAMVIWFLGGLFAFPDAPIHPCGPREIYLYSEHPYGYCGKQGQSRTLSDFHSFELWQAGMFCLWSSGMIAFGFLQKGRRKTKPPLSRERRGSRAP